MRKIIMFSSLILLLLCGCENEESDSNINADANEMGDIKLEDIFGEEEEIDVSFDENGDFIGISGIDLVFDYENLEGVSLKCENNMVNNKLNFSTKAKKLDVGVIIFVDGILQPVSFNGGASKEFNIITVGGEKTETDISYELISGKGGSSVRVNTMTLLNPSLEITENTTSVGVCFRESQNIALSAMCSRDVECEPGDSTFEKIPMPQDIKNIVEMEKKQQDAVIHIKAVYKQNGEETDRLSINGDRLVFDMELYGGEYGEYNLYVFLNNTSINCFNGKKYNQVKVSSDDITKVTVDADVSQLNLPEYTQLFVVAAPVGSIAGGELEKFNNIIVDNID